MPVLIRIMKKTVVRHLIYLTFAPYLTISFSDRFAFRPIGSPSPTAAIIFLLITMANMFLSSPFVIIISVNCSKAFNTVRHFTLLENMGLLIMPANVYSWLVTSSAYALIALCTRV